MNSKPMIASIFLLFYVALPVLGQPAQFEEQAGLVVIEAESATLDGAWRLQIANAGFTGDGYIVADEPEGTLVYDVRIHRPGRYLVLLRSAAPHPTEHNDTWFTLEGPNLRFTADDGPACSQFEDDWFKLFMNESDNTWSWNNKNCDHTEKRFYVHVPASGNYQLKLRARSPGHMVDRIVLRHDDATDGAAEDLGRGETRLNDGMTLTGTFQTWHRVTLTFDGPQASEEDDLNPFRDFRMSVTFTQGGRKYVVPGFFAADGDADETGATSGDQWRVHFSPDAPGIWAYQASFRQGKDAAIHTSPFSGEPTAFHGARGSFEISHSDKTGRDFRGKGRLQYVGDRYLRHAGSGEAFVKGGAGSPENLLAYADFDGTYDNGGPEQSTLTNGLHRYEPHVADWQEGDPVWKGGKGKGLIGGLNYLAGKGMNTVYFLTMNWEGDGNDVWPWVRHDQQDRFDVSKLAQWEMVFQHMDSLGLAMNVLFQETENDTLFDGGKLGDLRTLYFRELIARFGHHLGVTWNLGEENNNSTADRKAFAAYFEKMDPYNHPIVVHNHVHLIPETYQPLLGLPTFEGTSFQIANPDDAHTRVLQYVEKSAAAGRPWVVNLDEIGHYSTGITPDGPGNNHDQMRRNVLWGALMAGGAGVEWYFGYRFPHADLAMEDWRSRDAAWDMTRHALHFFQSYIPFDEMAPHDGLTWLSDDYILAKIGEIYALYRKKGGQPELELKDYPDATFSVQWYDPRRGTHLMTGDTPFVQGGSHVVPLGQPPYAPDEDWVILVKRIN